MDKPHHGTFHEDGGSPAANPSGCFVMLATDHRREIA
jgi:hypothetical protein